MPSDAAVLASATPVAHEAGDTRASPDEGALAVGPAAVVRDVILGGQDGLVNVLGLVLGMAAATGDARLVITAGLAALLAESIAMAGVAYTSSGAERQLAESTSRTWLEARDQVVAASARRRGRVLADAALADETRDALDEAATADLAALVAQLEREREALRPVRERRPIAAAATVGVSTALGSGVPLLPFVLLPVWIAAPVALAVSALVLAGAGFQRAVLAGGSRRRAVLEMLAIGLVSAFAGYVIGQILRAPGA